MAGRCNMIGRRVLTAAVTLMLLSFGGLANAAPPNQADVDACNQELAAAGAKSTSAQADTIKPAQSDEGASVTNSTVTGTDQPESDRSAVSGAQNGAAGAASRSA